MVAPSHDARKLVPDASPKPYLAINIRVPLTNCMGGDSILNNLANAYTSNRTRVTHLSVHGDQHHLEIKYLSQDHVLHWIGGQWHHIFLPIPYLRISNYRCLFTLQLSRV